MVAGAHVKFSDAVKLLGVTLDSALTFDKHITNITRCCYYHIRTSATPYSPITNT